MRRKSEPRRLLLCVGVLCFAAVARLALAQDQLNTITFDNRSGESALVKVSGPTSALVEVPDGASRTVAVAEGQYYLLVRYGAEPGPFRYAKGDPFRIAPAQGKYSAVTITLHTVIAGNYQVRPASRQEFDGLALGQQAAKAKEEVRTAPLPLPDIAPAPGLPPDDSYLLPPGSLALSPAPAPKHQHYAIRIGRALTAPDGTHLDLLSVEPEVEDLPEKSLVRLLVDVELRHAHGNTTAVVFPCSNLTIVIGAAVVPPEVCFIEKSQRGTKVRAVFSDSNKQLLLMPGERSSVRFVIPTGLKTADAILKIKGLGSVTLPVRFEKQFQIAEVPAPQPRSSLSRSNVVVVRGTLVDQDDKPLAGALVLLMAAKGDGPRDYDFPSKDGKFEGKTDANGRLLLLVEVKDLGASKDLTLIVRPPGSWILGRLMLGGKYLKFTIDPTASKNEIDLGRIIITTKGWPVL